MQFITLIFIQIIFRPFSNFISIVLQNLQWAKLISHKFFCTSNIIAILRFYNTKSYKSLHTQCKNIDKVGMIVGVLQ